jgi:hypothetical protein
MTHGDAERFRRFPPSLIGALEEQRRVRPTQKAIVRNRNRLRAYIDVMPDRGVVWVFPMGYDGRMALAAMRAREMPSVAGGVDSAARTLGAACETAITPEELQGKEYDAVLVCHVDPDAEAALAAHLEAAGVPSGKIVRLYDDPDYVSFALQGWKDAFSASLPLPTDGVDCVIIRSSDKTIIEDEALKAAFPTDRTIIANFAAQSDEKRRTAAGYVEYGLDQSLELLESLLAAIRPKTILLQTWLGHHYLACFVRSLYADSMIIVEPFDVWVSSIPPDKALFARAVGMSDGQRDLNLFGEEHFFRHADLVVSKRTGDNWRKIIEPRGCRYRYYYPLSDKMLENDAVASSDPAERAGVAPRTAKEIRIINAGNIPPPRMARENPELFVSYMQLELLEELGRSMPVSVDVFNLLHSGAAPDADYAEYVERCRRGPIRYHRGVRLDQLMRMLGDYDYGWLHLVVPDDIADGRMVMPNRFCTYISAGLPVIVSADLAQPAKLVAEYDAGVIVPGYDAAQTVAAMQGANPAAHRAGALRLRDAMRRHNEEVMSDLQFVTLGRGDIHRLNRVAKENVASPGEK